MSEFVRPDLDEVRAFYDREANTGLVIRVPEADPVVGLLRSAADPAAAFGVESHVTVLFPFLPREDLGREVEDAIAAIALRHEAFDAEFASVGRFPEVAWLAPGPAHRFSALTEAITEEWPDQPPYGGEFEEPVPHLTIGHGPDERLDLMADAVRPSLPVRTRVDVIELLVFDGEWWRLRRRFPLGR